MWEMQVQNEDTLEWYALRPSEPKGAPPYRYDKKQDAEEMLKKLYPYLHPSYTRVVRV